jgi:uncharacterized SAM-binding protein YcdF (DUF218 family)
MLFACLLAACWAGGFLWFVMNLPPAKSADTLATQGIVVLTGGRDRMVVGIELLQKGLGQRLLISGVNEDISDDHLQRVLHLKNIEKLFDCCIDTGRAALDTRGNAQELAAWADANEYSTIRLVTAAYHMPRAIAEISGYAPALTLQPHPVYPDNVKIDEWWAYPGTALVLAKEYNKYLASIARLNLFDAAEDQE